MNMIKLIQLDKVSFILLTIIYFSCSLTQKGNKNNNLKQSSKDSIYNFSTYIKKNEIGDVEVIGQFLNGKKDGSWRYFSNGKLNRIEYYNSSKQILVINQETENSLQTYQLLLPDFDRKTFSYNQNILKSIKTTTNSKITEEEIEYYNNTDTLIIHNQINDSIFYQILTDKKNSFYDISIPLYDSTIIYLDLKNKKMDLKKN